MISNRFDRVEVVAALTTPARKATTVRFTVK